MLYNGKGIDKDIEKAKSLWEYGCSCNHSGSYLRLSDLYSNPLESYYDEAKAKEYRQKAEEYGSNTAAKS